MFPGCRDCGFADRFSLLWWAVADFDQKGCIWLWWVDVLFPPLALSALPAVSAESSNSSGNL